MKLEKIMIGIDDSLYADRAIAYGFELARKFNAEIGLVHVISPAASTPVAEDNITGMPLETVPVMAPDLMDIEEIRSTSIFDAVVKKYGEGLQVSHFTEYGDTAEALVSSGVDFNADMIIIGTHSRTGIDRLLMGSVAEHVVRHSTVPVLVIPSPEIEKP